MRNNDQTICIKAIASARSGKGNSRRAKGLGYKNEYYKNEDGKAAVPPAVFLVNKHGNPVYNKALAVYVTPALENSLVSFADELAAAGSVLASKNKFMSAVINTPQFEEFCNSMKNKMLCHIKGDKSIDFDSFD